LVVQMPPWYLKKSDVCHCEDDSMKGGGTTPGKEEIESRREQRPRAVSGTKAERSDEAISQDIDSRLRRLLRCARNDKSFNLIRDSRIDNNALSLEYCEVIATYLTE
jgi:hypothetical protein